MSASIASAPFACRRITPDDAGAAQRLSASIGWPHRREDWRFSIRTGTGFVAEIDGTVVGTAMCWKFGAHQATLGMVIVAAGHRRRGIGRALMQRVLDELGDREITLYATAMAKPLFDALGFIERGTLEQYQGAAFRPPLVALPAGERLRPLGANDTAQLAELATRARGLERSQLLPVLLGHADGIALDHDGELLGFSLFRRFGRGFLIGPVIAAEVAADIGHRPDAGDATATTDAIHTARAKALIRHWLALNEGALVRIDIPGDSALRDWLTGLGLARSETVVKMTLHGDLPRPDANDEDDANVLAATSAGAPLHQFAVINQSLT